MRITKSFIDKLTPPERTTTGQSAQAFYRDSVIPGFGLRITSAGAIAFIIEKRMHGKVKRMTLGRYGNLTVEQARKEAMRILGKVAIGKDPIAERKAKIIKGTTLLEAYHDYLATRKNLKPTTISDYQRSIDSSYPDWQNLPLKEITKDMVELRHRLLGERSHARANNAMRLLRAIFNHARKKYEDDKGNPIIVVNPVDRLSDTRAWYTIKPRQTLIKPHQLADWYQATMQLNNETTRDFLHFLLFNGLRRSEAASLTWETVDFKDKTFTIPDTKNHLPHTLPMSDFVEEMLVRRFEDKDSLYVFPSDSKRGYLIEPKTAVAKVAKISGVPFTLHDLRRTFITIADSLDIPAYALKRLLNHKDPNDVTSSYIICDVERLRAPIRDIASFILSYLT